MPVISQRFTNSERLLLKTCIPCEFSGYFFQCDFACLIENSSFILNLQTAGDIYYIAVQFALLSIHQNKQEICISTQ